MKTNLVLVGLFTLLFITGSCIKDTSCHDKTPQSEQAAILAYATANSINVTAHSSGLYYEIVNAGSGVTPNANSKVFVGYTGKLLNGTVFDSQTNPAATGFILNGLIQGWQIGLQLIHKGGTIRLLVPSSLGYGCNGFGTVPGNSILYFDIYLADVQ
jgi:FKBP-type peptidyl-prolyl cis-trans isomerase FkpA